MFRYVVACAVALTLILLAGAAWAAGIPDPTGDPQGFAQIVMGAATAKQWGFLAVLAILALLGVLRKFGGKVWGGFATDAGGAALALGFALVLPLAVVLATGASLSWPLYVGAVTATAAASGLWSWASKLGAALLAKLAR